MTIHLYYISFSSLTAGPIHNVETVMGSQAELPCDVAPAPTVPGDRFVLVLWYKDGIGTPIYRSVY